MGNWINVVPPIYRKGRLLESESSDCIKIRWTPLDPSIDFICDDCGYMRWVNLDPSTDYLCSGVTKMYKQQLQESLDSGATWQNVVPPVYRMGEAYQYYSTDCGYAERWINMDINTNYWCESCEAPTPNEYKVRGIRQNGESYGIVCDGSVLYEGSLVGTSALTVEVGDCITEIQEHAFYYSVRQSDWTYKWYIYRDINSVYIPSTVTSIPQRAFREMTGLVSCTLPETLTSIGSYAFSGCIQLHYLDLWDGITSIGEFAFADCDSLTQIHIPSGLTSISNGVFGSCGAVYTIDIPNSVTSIGVGSFSGCNSLHTVTIGSGITSIGDSAFSGCSALNSITINTTTPPTLGRGTFGEMNVFTDTNNCPIYVPCEYVDTYKTTSGWTTYESRIQPIPGTCIERKWKVTYSDNHTETANCDSTSAITQNEIQSNSAVTAEIGHCVTSITFSAFSGFGSLLRVSIPDSVTFIADWAFYGSSSLISITFEGTTPPNIGANAFTGTNDCPIYVPEESVNTYKTTGNWSNYASRIVGY